MRWVRLGMSVLAWSAISLAAEAPVRPACTTENVGRFWPDEANDNPKFAAALMPYGYPEVCTLLNGKYVWRSHTVSVTRLSTQRRQDKRKPSKPEGSGAASGR